MLNQMAGSLVMENLFFWYLQCEPRDKVEHFKSTSVQHDLMGSAAKRAWISRLTPRGLFTNDKDNSLFFLTGTAIFTLGDITTCFQDIAVAIIFQ